jgi:hypothetical protein
LETITYLQALPYAPQPGQIVHINDVLLLHEALRRKRRYAMVGYPTQSINGLIVIEIIPMTHAEWGPMKVSIFESRCGSQSYLCFGHTSFLTLEDFDSSRVRVTSRLIPEAIDLLARRPRRRPTATLPIAA